MSGTPGGIRTHDLRIRSPLLYPAELPERMSDGLLIWHVGREFQLCGRDVGEKDVLTSRRFATEEGDAAF